MSGTTGMLVMQRFLRRLQSTDLVKYFAVTCSLRGTGVPDNDLSLQSHKTHKSYGSSHHIRAVSPSELYNNNAYIMSNNNKSALAQATEAYPHENSLERRGVGEGSTNNTSSSPSESDSEKIKAKNCSFSSGSVSLFSNSVGDGRNRNDILNVRAKETPFQQIDSQPNSNRKMSGAEKEGANSNGVSCDSNPSEGGVAKKACFKSGLSDIVQFLELVGSLKHTKRTGWVLRNVPDCESISGHMYRMSLMTFLLDGTEGLNQIRCMELALVHDLAESLVGDITPFCGVSKEEKKAMELKAMEDICKLIEPRGKRIMELFEEYENAESAESKFVKDLDRLDMVLQAFEYEKRDDCVMKHQEFFDSTHGKFNHPFVIKLVNEIHDQRRALAIEKGVESPNQNGENGYHEEPASGSATEKTASSS